MTATACCSSNSIIYQIPVIATRSQFTPILPRASIASSILSTPDICKPPIKFKSDINNNNNNDNNNNNKTQENIEEIFHVTSDDEEEILAYVGLRRKTKKSSVSLPILRPLAKRLTAPLCLLPLAKNGDRVRQSLYILLPFLKFLSITNDIELFCSSDGKATADSLLLRSLTQTQFITMATNTFRNNTKRTPMAKYIHSTIQCSVVLDRLEQSTINQIMQNSAEDNPINIVTPLLGKRSLSNSSESSLTKTQRSLSRTTTETTTTRTTITTMTTEKTTVKHQTTTSSSFNNCKRFKNTSDNDKSSSTYQRIYLKCFVCSKRDYIDSQETNSDILHSHWLEHENDLSLNIYDSEIDSILTRVVEFFHFPKRHTLEGKIQTVFILNSKEIRKTSDDDDSCIILD
ncbi:unnamed protein product [Adineta steineri]|uniref:Uncharacterized protein n=1 Tax=Adineta steineri TaxID=433720 RepID=A0A818SSM8_9BILA|nr:unnamed protein product [Adineta steineri]